MNFDRFIAVVACIATVLCTIIAVLSYLYKQKRKKMTAQSDPLQRSCVLLGQKETCGDDQMFGHLRLIKARLRLKP